MRECDKGEDFCITITHTDKTDGFAFRGCWSTEYEEGRYNFTGCEVRVRHLNLKWRIFKWCKTESG